MERDWIESRRQGTQKRYMRKRLNYCVKSTVKRQVASGPLHSFAVKFPTNRQARVSVNERAETKYKVREQLHRQHKKEVDVVY